MIKHEFACLAVAAGLTLLAAACGTAGGASVGSTAVPADSPTQQPAPTPVPFPVLTDTGVRGIMISDPGGVLRICETDAFVESLGGKAQKISAAPAGFQLTRGEQIVHSNGKPMADDGTLVQLPVMRDADGRLVHGWRHCEEHPSPQDEPSSDEHASP